MRKLLAGCGSCAGLLAMAGIVLLVIIVAVIVAVILLYMALIYAWLSGETTIPASIHGMPANGVITATFHDPDYFDMFGTEHQGLDIANASGTPVYCTSDEARLVDGGWDSSGYGLFLKLQDVDSGYYLLYAHLESLAPQIVTAYLDGSIGDGSFRLYHGDPIGGMGSTGNSTGTHLHYEIREPDNTPVDPEGSEGCCNP